MAKTKHNSKYTGYVAAVVLIVAFLLVAVSQLTTPVQSLAKPNSVGGEAGIIKADGTVIKLTVKTSSLAVFIVNSRDVSANDFIYWKFWLNLQTSGVSGNLTTVHFKLWQKWNGAVSGFNQGTENSNPPATNPVESWFQVALPQDQMVVVPLKYRDSFDPPENATNVFPFSTLSSDGTHVIRDRRIEYTGNFIYLDYGTYTWQMICTVIGVTWEHNGISETITPSPNEISFTFTVTKASGLTVTLSGQGSS